MKRRVLFFAAALGILTAGLLYPVPVATSSDDCDECVENCNNIPMDPQACLEQYCPECASRLGGGT